MRSLERLSRSGMVRSSALIARQSTSRGHLLATRTNALAITSTDTIPLVCGIAL